jgi:type VI secretion system protein ImpA
MGNTAQVERPLTTSSDRLANRAEYGVEYTAEFHELDAMVSAFDSEGLGPLRKGERPFQWGDVAIAAENLLALSPDLRVGMWLLRALLDLHGVTGLVDGLARICALLELPEADLFPRAIDGESAREAHAVSMAWIGSSTLLHQLRSAPLAPHISMTCDELHKDDSLARSLETSAKADLSTALQRGQQHLDQITHILQQNGAHLPFNMAPLHEEMAFVCNALGIKNHGHDSGVAPTAGLHTAPAPPSAASRLGIHRREEVQQSLSGLISYFKEHEPGHPAPLLLLRVQRMLGASFEELMTELYADAKQLVARIEKPQTP